MNLPYLLFATLLLEVSFSSPANAHITADMGSGFMAGLTHPVFGLDHLLAMLSVGIISTQLKHRWAIWTLPGTFVCVMILGGAVGLSGLKVSGTELGISLSVMALGTSIFFGSKLFEPLIYLCVGFFALCHGYAHGSEMPDQAEAAKFVLGFIISTIVIHLAGVSFGLFSTKINDGKEYLRFVGGLIAGMGIQFFLAAVGFTNS